MAHWTKTVWKYERLLRVQCYKFVVTYLTINYVTKFIFSNDGKLELEDPN